MSQLIWDIIINHQERIFDLNKSHKGRPKNCDISLWIKTNLTWQKYRFRLQKGVKFENRYHILNFHGLIVFVVTFYQFKRRFNDQFTSSNRFSKSKFYLKFFCCPKQHEMRTRSITNFFAIFERHAYFCMDWDWKKGPHF